MAVSTINEKVKSEEAAFIRVRFFCFWLQISKSLLGLYNRGGVRRASPRIAFERRLSTYCTRHQNAAIKGIGAMTWRASR